MPPQIDQYLSSIDELDDPSLHQLAQEIRLLDRIDTSANRTYFPDLKGNARGSCGDCSHRIRVKSAYELSRGQHIEMPGEINKVYVPSYMHHAVVAHATAIDDCNVEVDLVHMTNHNGCRQLCRETKTYDLKELELYVIDYYHPRYTREQVAKRAEMAENTIKTCKTHFSSYNLVTTNCEHFATWCVVGETDTYEGHDWMNKIIEGICKRGYSRQVMEWITGTLDAVRYVFGHGSKAMHFIQQFLLESSDEICRLLGDIIPNFMSSGTTLTLTSAMCYLYCNAYSLYLDLRKFNGYICKSCYDKKLSEMWSKFAIYGVTSAATLCLAIGGGISFPVVATCLGLILLSIGLQYYVPKVRELFLAPYCCTKKGINRLSELKIADIVTISYYGLPHDILLTEIRAERNDKKGKLRAIHYATDSLISERTVREDFFHVNLSNWKSILFWQVKRHECLHLPKYEPKESVARARKRIGETKWNAVSNRSDHVCYWAKVRKPVLYEYKDGKSGDITKYEKQKQQGRATFNECIPQNNQATQNHRLGAQDWAPGPISLGFWLIEESEVHLSEEIEIGDVIRYEGKESFVIDKAGNDRIMNLRVIFVAKDRKEKGIRVNLNIKTVQVLSFLPTICFDKPTRAENAVKFKREAISKEIFKKKCILKNYTNMKELTSGKCVMRMILNVFVR